MKSTSIRAIDLFAGAGGLSVGLKAAQFKVLAAIELDPVAAHTYSRNHPDVKIWNKDIAQVKVAELRRKLRLKAGELDLLAGCPPCQGFSTMRTLNGGKRVVDGRNDLIFEFLRFVRGLRPKMIMMENVPGLARDRRIREFISQVERLGYHCAMRVVDAADYGVPQRRRRMILLAARRSSAPFATPAKARRSVADAIKKLPKAGQSGDALHDLPENRAEHVRELIRSIPRNGGSRTDAPQRFQLACHRKVDGFFDVYGRMAWDDVSPTITSGCHNPSKGRFLHPTEHRAITLREAALLQTFPRRYFFSLDGGKEHAALLIGNALPPALIRRFASPLAKRLLADREVRVRRKRGS